VNNFKAFGFKQSKHHNNAVGLTHLLTVNNQKTFKFTAMIGYCVRRKLVRMEKGYITLVPEEMQISDEIVLCKGSKLPLLARRYGTQWKLLECCYVHRIMYGEAWDESKCTKMEFI